MLNKVIKFINQPYGEHQIGFCVVDMSGKCTVVLKVIKSKAGNMYCAFNSVRLGDEWTPDFGFTDKEHERNFLGECYEQLKLMMNVQSQPSQPTPTQYQQAPQQQEQQAQQMEPLKGLPF